MGINFWNPEQFNFFLWALVWSFLCFFSGVAVAVSLYHYWIQRVMKRATKLLNDLKERDKYDC